MTTTRRILIVDDDDAIRALLMTVLRRRGYEVEGARNGAEALERLLEARYSLVLLDLMMPKVSGYEVLDHLIAEPNPPMVLILTAGLEPKPHHSQAVLGTIQKPFDVSVLVDAVAGCLSTLEPKSTPLTDAPDPGSWHVS